MRGLFFVLDGIDGSGKSTQAALLADWLEQQAPPREVVRTREPGGTRAGLALRALLRDPHIPLAPRTALLLFLADRRQHCEEVLWPALERGAVVVCDRFADSTLVYHAGRCGLSRPPLMRLEREARMGLEPDCTVILDCPAALAHGRLRARDRGADRYDEGPTRLGHLRAAYLEQSCLPRRVLIDGARSEPLVAREIREIVRPHLLAPLEEFPADHRART